MIRKGAAQYLVPGLSNKQYGFMKEVHVDADPAAVMTLLGPDADMVAFTGNKISRLRKSRGSAKSDRRRAHPTPPCPPWRGDYVWRRAEWCTMFLTGPSAEIASSMTKAIIWLLRRCFSRGQAQRSAGMSRGIQCGQDYQPRPRVGVVKRCGWGIAGRKALADAAG